MKRLTFVFFDAGGGHRSAATALQLAIRDKQIGWNIHLMNLQDALDSLDVLRQFTGIRIQNFYNSMLKSGWTLGSTELMRVLQAVIRLYHKAAVSRLEEYWRNNSADMVVSFVPHFNRALFESFRNVFPERPFVTVLTDIADYPPHFWIERQPQYLICGSDRAIAQARSFGHTDGRIFQASGMILHPRFYESQPPDRAAERRRLGLLPDLPTGLVLFGGQGSRTILNIVERLERSALDLQLILICGKNIKLANDLRRRKSRIRYFVEDFTVAVPYYMHLSDFFIGKPGPGSLSEALAKGLPVITVCNSWTLPQERYNARWIAERNVGISLRSFRQIVPAVEKLLRPEQLNRCRESTRLNTNRAVFEVPGFLQDIFKKAESVSAKDIERLAPVAATAATGNR